MMRKADEQLYWAYLAGDDEALRELLERHREGLMLFLYGMVGNMEDAEELMMDSFAALLAKNKRFAGRSSFKTWLFAIGRNHAKMHLRKKKIKEVALDDQLSTPSQCELQVLQNERNYQLFLALQEIRTEYRDALLLFYYEEMEIAEIAGIMKLSRRQISNRLYYGKQALKKVLEKKGITDAEFR